MTIREQILLHLASLSRKKRPTNIKIAEVLGITTRSFEKWRAGTTGLKESNLNKLLNFLGLEIKEAKDEQAKHTSKNIDT